MVAAALTSTSVPTVAAVLVRFALAYLAVGSLTVGIIEHAKR